MNTKNQFQRVTGFNRKTVSFETGSIYKRNSNILEFHGLYFVANTTLSREYRLI